MLKRFLLLMLALTSSAGAQVSPENNTPFWRTTCARTDAAKELFDALASAAKNAETCRVEQDQSRTQYIALTEELKKARLDLESAREETKAARAEMSAALRRADELLKRALSENSNMGTSPIKSSNVAACVTRVQDYFIRSPEWRFPNKTPWGARALSTSSTCGANAWCSEIANKDGESLFIVHVACTDNRELEFRKAIQESVQGLR